MEQTLASTTRRRGHQHHPRHATRRRIDVASGSSSTSSRGPAQCGPAALVDSPSTAVAQHETNTLTRNDQRVADVPDVNSGATCPNLPRPPTIGRRWQRNIDTLESSSRNANSTLPLPSPNFTSNLIEATRTLTPVTTTSNTTTNDTAEGEEDRTGESISVEGKARKEDVLKRLAQCSQDVRKNKRHGGLGKGEICPEKSLSESKDDGKGSSSTASALKTGGKDSPEPEHAVARARGDGNSDDEAQNVEEDPELAELAKLRCPSERTEVQAEREARRRKRCADYPGLAFGSSIFSSDTIFKFSLIKNELQNIMSNQLKRVSIS